MKKFYLKDQCEKNLKLPLFIDLETTSCPGAGRGAF
jgi:hypothetical protein